MSKTPIMGLSALVLSGILIYLLAPVLTPFLFAALLAYIANPLVAQLQAWRVPRTLGVILVFVLFVLLLCALVLVLIPRIEKQLSVFISKIPTYVDWVQGSLMPWLQDLLGEDAPVLDFALIKTQLIQHWQALGGFVGQSFSYLSRSGLHMAAWVVNIALVPLVTFYLLRDWDVLIKRVHALFPRRHQATIGRLARETDDVLASFLRGQLSVMFALAVIYSVGLWWVGLDLALPIGVLAGLVSFVPYLGFIIGLLTAGTAAILQFHDVWMLAWVVGVFAVGQALESALLTPYLVGERIGLHPVAVIFAIMAGGQLFGFVGILLALPAAAALRVWLSHWHAAYQAPAVRRSRTKSSKRS